MKRDKTNWTCLLPNAVHVQAVMRPLTVEQLEQQDKALLAAFGILKGKGIFPEDTLDYQREVRAEDSAI
ncbi:hypothetical protein GJ698_18985 [Pseudoduganella sp. FT26W]|uniref:Uncharacterized protein n=1 Tax=Duganella aquatilis TaxID=2666082 RepID=A0A844D5I0_9BURK|nr:hypothetical protein [Duganella aquatilis]MRW86161.1 hypothetical protein [Duganella aquatilis]